MNATFNLFLRFTLGFVFLFIAFGCSSEEKVALLDERVSYQSGAGSTRLVRMTSDSATAGASERRDGRGGGERGQSAECGECGECDECGECCEC